MRRSGAITTVLAVVIALTGCSSDGPPLSPACTGNPAAVQLALRAAPARVALRDGTTLSNCILAATAEADLQNIGITFHTVAEKLGETASTGNEAAAVQLGYLIGATRRGASKTNGVLLELQRRIELVGSRVQDKAPQVTAQLRRGSAAGEATG